MQEKDYKSELEASKMIIVSQSEQIVKLETKVESLEAKVLDRKSTRLNSSHG